MIIGGGESGVGAALLAKKKKYEVYLTDFGEINQEYKDELNEHNIPFEERGHNIDKIKSFGFDLIVKSPGVPNHAPIFGMLNIEDRNVVSEIEFGSIHYSGKILAITGSNGKTTTSGLLFHMLHEAGLVVIIGGNYGKSFCRLIMDQQPEFAVLEISSFQLDNVKTFAPQVAILLNITPDHLDRYEYDLGKYANAKFRIAENQNKDDLLIVNGDDEIIEQGLKSRSFNANVYKVFESQYVKGIIRDDIDQVFDIPLKGKHNAFNTYCAITAARRVGVKEEVIQRALLSFRNEPHRLEEVAIIDDVTFINDSKATNVDAVFYALDALDSKIIWIAGGTDKGNDYEMLKEVAKAKVKALICLGIDNEKLESSFKNVIPIAMQTTDVNQAVQSAYDIAMSGETVLLSPACASFDLFKNYIDRGDQFKLAVHDLEKKT